MNSSKEQLAEALSELKGQRAWGLCRTHGSMFFLEFGQAIQKQLAMTSHGPWHFILEMCAWRFENSKGILLASEDDTEKIDAAFERLELGTLLDVSLNCPALDLHFIFSSGIELKTFGIYSSDMSTGNWMLFMPNEQVFSAKCDGLLSYKSIHE